MTAGDHDPFGGAVPQEIPKETCDRFGVDAAYIEIGSEPPSDEARERYAADCRAWKYGGMAAIFQKPPRGPEWQNPARIVLKVGTVFWREDVFATARSERFEAECMAAMERGSKALRDAIRSGDVVQVGNVNDKGGDDGNDD